MIEDAIVKLFRTNGMGEVKLPIRSVSGGFMHRMYRVNTDKGSYAVKYLNPEIMKRPKAMENFKRAEMLEGILEEAGISIAPAMTFQGRKMLEQDGEYFYFFRWLDGRTTDWDHITVDQCRQAGNIQGRIHSLQARTVEHTEPEISAIRWEEYVQEAERQHSVIAPLLKEHQELLEYAQGALNAARKALPDIECITDEDMDPKNVMWVDGKAVVIDLECLDYGNPVSHALQLALQWAGITTCDLNPELQKAFLEGYLEAYDNGFRDYGSVLGLAYTWIEWLEYNITRALGNCQDENEREMGITEVRNTIRRLQYLHEKEDAIRESLKQLF